MSQGQRLFWVPTPWDAAFSARSPALPPPGCNFPSAQLTCASGSIALTAFLIASVWIIRRFVEQRALTMGRRYESKHCGKLYYCSGVRAVSNSRWNMPAFPPDSGSSRRDSCGRALRPTATSAAAIRNVRSTSIRDMRKRLKCANSRRSRRCSEQVKLTKAILRRRLEDRSPT
jgi:hypothetical protein